MRVTQQMMAGSMLANLNQLRARQSSLSDQITSGDRITRVSEDPTSGAEVMRLQSRSQSVKQWTTNLNDTKSWVYATEAKLGDITDLLAEVKDLALQGSNGTLSPETRKELAPAADQLLQDLVGALNEREPVGALFGGFATDTAPFALDMATGIVTYTGDSGDLQRDVGPGVTMTANVHGNRLAANLPGGWADPNNMLTTVWNVVQGLQAGDPSMVAAQLNTLDTARQDVVALRSEMGARQMRIEAIETRLQDMEVKLGDAFQQAQGVDMAKAIMELTSAETTYRAALQVGGRLLPQSLADFLR